MHVKEQNTGKPDCRYHRTWLKEEPFTYTHKKNPKQNMKAKRKNELSMLREEEEENPSHIF